MKANLQKSCIVLLVAFLATRAYSTKCMEDGTELAETLKLSPELFMQDKLTIEALGELLVVFES